MREQQLVRWFAASMPCLGTCFDAAKACDVIRLFGLNTHLEADPGCGVAGCSTETESDSASSTCELRHDESVDCQQAGTYMCGRPDIVNTWQPWADAGNVETGAEHAPHTTSFTSLASAIGTCAAMMAAAAKPAMATCTGLRRASCGTNRIGRRVAHGRSVVAEAA